MSDNAAQPKEGVMENFARSVYPILVKSGVQNRGRIFTTADSEHEQDSDQFYSYVGKVSQSPFA